MKQNERLIAWFIAFVLALIFLLFQALSCVSVRVQTGEDNKYEGQTKETTGIDSDVKNTTQKDSVSLTP